ncbi:MAG TPA: HEAT repeat domain-containing protein [Pirellulales bacterium]
MKPGKWRLVVGLCATCLASAISLGVLLPYRQALLARYWETELARAPDDRVGEALVKLANLGDPGIDAVSRALGSPRAIVSQRAYEVLTDKIDACARLTPLEAHDRLTTLAAAVAAGAEQAPAARGAAARLAVRMLLWPGEGTLDRSRLVADCERVLQAGGAQKTARPKPAAAARASDRRTKKAPHLVPAPHRHDLETLANRPDTSLAIADLVPPALQRAAAADQAEPGRFDDTDTAALTDQRADTKGNLGEQSTVSDQSLVSPAAHERGETSRLKALDAFALFAQLHESDATAANAAVELQARGFSIRQIEVGMHLCSPDAHERRLWTEYLPGIRGVSAKAWLLHLSRDESVGVRRAAMNLLATSGDPEMLRRVGELAHEDRDPDLRLEAARAVELLESDLP